MTARQGLLPITAAVLAGGRSTRMGVDKALLRIEGEVLVCRAVRAVSQTCERVVVVTNRPGDLADVGLAADIPILVDEVAYQGPLGGIAAALVWTPHDWVLAVAADMPWIAPGIVHALWAARGDAAVVLPVTDRGPEPLLALYHRSCLPFIQAALAQGRLRLLGLLDEVPVVRVPAESLRAVDPELHSFTNLNTPEDLARAVQRCEVPGPR